VAGWVAYPPSIALATTVVAAIIIVRHRANIQRLRAGTESRLGRRASAA
jgi:glycerol-3-phosphate acyltransferase PlsY